MKRLSAVLLTAVSTSASAAGTYASPELAAVNLGLNGINFLSSGGGTASTLTGAGTGLTETCGGVSCYVTLSWAGLNPAGLVVVNSNTGTAVTVGTLALKTDGEMEWTGAGITTLDTGLKLPADTSCALHTGSSGAISCNSASAGATHQFATGISALDVLSYGQPAFVDISGTASPAQLPAATASAQGAVVAPSCAGTSSAYTSISSSGTLQCGSISGGGGSGVTAVTTSGPLSGTIISGTLALTSPLTIASGTGTLTVGAGTTTGDLQVSYTSQTMPWTRVSYHFDSSFILSFTPNFTTAAWAVGSYAASGTTPGTSGWVATGGNVYRTAATCTAATGDAPTSTSGTQTTADGCQWIYVSAQASGNWQINGLPYSVPNDVAQACYLTYGTAGISSFTWPGSGTNLIFDVQPNKSYMRLFGAKSGGGGALASVSGGVFVSGTTYTLNGHCSLRMGTE